MRLLPNGRVIPTKEAMAEAKGCSQRFYTRHGWLTSYALACGYREISKLRTVILSRHAGTSTYSVEVAEEEASGWTIWQEVYSGPNLAEAGKVFTRECQKAPRPSATTGDSTNATY